MPINNATVAESYPGGPVTVDIDANFASAAWVGRTILGNASPWHQLDLLWDEAPGWDGIPWDREAEPSLDEVLTVRCERQRLFATS